MRNILLLIVLLALNTRAAFCQSNVMYEYNISGKLLQETEIRGSLKVMLRPLYKMIIDGSYYQEQGNPLPEYIKKTLIVDYKNDQKSILSTEAVNWIRSSVSEDYALLSDDLITIISTNTDGKINIEIYITLEPELGGLQEYSIEILLPKDYSVSGAKDMDDNFTKPYSLDFFSMFIDNEKIINMLSSELADVKYVIPEAFTLSWKQDDMIKTQIKGFLKNKRKTPINDN